MHLFLLHPSPALWDEVAGAAGAGRAPRATTRPPRSPRNRLLASWGQDAREMQLVLGARRARRRTTTPVEHGRDTLLARIQADVRADRAPPARRCRTPPTRGRGSTPTTAASRSTPATAARARSRSLRDAILHLLADDPTLEPRDVIVMCPDIETFAPLIQATFGAGEVADDDELEPLPPSSGRPTCACGSPTARCARPTRCSASSRELLELAGRRLTASQVLDLADREPVRRRFRLDDDDLARHRGVGRRQRHPLGPGRRPPRAVQARMTLAGRHVARRGWTACSSA